MTTEDFKDIELCSPDAKRHFKRMMKAFHEKDDEVAHSAEDNFHQAILIQILKLSQMALKTSDLPFSRWCA